MHISLCIEIKEYICDNYIIEGILNPMSLISVRINSM